MELSPKAITNVEFHLVRKGYDPVKVYWKGPSVGFDFGANASKVFTLVYNLKEERRLAAASSQTACRDERCTR